MKSCTRANTKRMMAITPGPISQYLFKRWFSMNYFLSKLLA